MRSIILSTVEEENDKEATAGAAGKGTTADQEAAPSPIQNNQAAGRRVHNPWSETVSVTIHPLNAKPDWLRSPRSMIIVPGPKKNSPAISGEGVRNAEPQLLRRFHGQLLDLRPLQGRRKR
jgi:hypothetical protein